MSLLERFASHRALRAALEANRRVPPIATPMDAVHSATSATIDGRRVLLAGTNNDLGLTYDAECRAGGNTRRAVDRERRNGDGIAHDRSSRVSLRQEAEAQFPTRFSALTAWNSEYANRALPILRDREVLYYSRITGQRARSSAVWADSGTAGSIQPSWASCHSLGSAPSTGMLDRADIQMALGAA